MQNAKDTFYEALRTRLASINPERTIVVRGVTRPALLVVENELAMPQTPPDCFLMHWTSVTTDGQHALPLVTQRCEISYETAGSGWNAGLDRGRLLASMDSELLAVLTQAPASTPKLDYTSLASGAGLQPAAPHAMTTRIWWSAPVFTAVETKRDRVARTASLEVMSFVEGGEL